MNNKFVIIIIHILLAANFTNAQKYELYQGDTINYTDQNNLKQGLWIYFNDEYQGRIAKKGFYKDNKKNGLWEIYYKNGNLKSQITYKDNRQYGEVKIFYENGSPKEEGYWKINKWVGEYKYYYDNGQIKYHWFFDENGKRTGFQEYYYDNGVKQIEGEWKQGKESGQIKEYYANGNLQKVSTFSEGTLNGQVVEYYSDGQIKSKSVYVSGKIDINQSYAYQPKQNTNNDNTAVKDTAKTEYKTFNGTGFYKFVNDKGLVEREGNFVNGVLMDGKRYIYDDNGKKIKTIIIENGRKVKVINEQTNNEQ